MTRGRINLISFWTIIVGTIVFLSGVSLLSFEIVLAGWGIAILGFVGYLLTDYQ